MSVLLLVTTCIALSKPIAKAVLIVSVALLSILNYSALPIVNPVVSENTPAVFCLIASSIAISQ